MSQSIFVFAQNNIETKKIDYLLDEVKKLKGARFWRNGTYYTPQEAVDYLRMKMKWNETGRKVRTAEGFIENVASKSTISGKPYLIIYDDGRREQMKDFLSQKLNEWKE